MAKFPTRVSPMLCTLVDEPPAGAGWVFETKWDGERCVAFVERRGTRPAAVRLQSRLFKDQTARFPELAEDLAGCLKAKSAVIDGEIIALDGEGRADFATLARRFGLKDPDEIQARMMDTPVWYMAFDLLWLDGKDLRSKPLFERRRLLAKIVGGCGRIRFSKDYGDATELSAAVKKLGMEGIVAKRADAPYREGERARRWLKIKVTSVQECVVGGWTEGKGRRNGTFGALILGVYEERDGKRRLVPVGSVGTGFDEGTMGRLLRKLRPLARKGSPFARAPEVNDRPHWVRPKLVVQVKFANWTPDGHLRAPVYLGLRKDKRPEECVRESPARP